MGNDTRDGARVKKIQQRQRAQEGGGFGFFDGVAALDGASTALAGRGLGRRASRNSANGSDDDCGGEEERGLGEHFGAKEIESGCLLAVRGFWDVFVGLMIVKAARPFIYRPEGSAQWCSSAWPRRIVCNFECKTLGWVAWHA